LILLLNTCATTVAILDAAVTTRVYTGKTVVNTVAMVTLDIVIDEDGED